MRGGSQQPGITFGQEFGRPANARGFEAAWRAEVEEALARWEGKEGITDFPEQHLILVMCRDDREQVALLRRRQEGVECKALVG